MSISTLTIDEVDSSCRELLQRAYDAFNARDVDAALTCMDCDVDWPNAMEGSYMYGHKAVHDYWIRQWNMIDPQIEPMSYTHDEEGNILVEVHQVVRDIEGNIISDDTIYHAYLVMQGVIKRMEIRKMKPVASGDHTEAEPQQQVA
jgi:hypothetical protein